jgi:hypothetical protein
MEIKVIASCMKWDIAMIDIIRAEVGLSDESRNKLQAIREHLGNYLIFLGKVD